MYSAMQHVVLFTALLSTATGCAWVRSVAKRYQPRPHIIAVEEAPEQVAQRAAARRPVNVATNIGIEGDLPHAAPPPQSVEIPRNVVPQPKRVVEETIALRPEQLFNKQKRGRNLTPKGKQQLDRLASQLARYQAEQQLLNVAIVDYSQAEQGPLARQRVELVRDYLAGKGVDRARVTPRASPPAAHCKSKKNAKRAECSASTAGRMEVVIRKRISIAPPSA